MSETDTEPRFNQFPAGNTSGRPTQPSEAGNAEGRIRRRIEDHQELIRRRDEAPLDREHQT